MDPYYLGLPASPEDFVGRAKLVRWALETPVSGKRRTRASAALVTGSPGSGKTSAVDKICHIVSTTIPDSLRVHIPFFGERPRDPILGIIATEVARKLRELEGSADRFRRALARLKAINFTILGSGVGFEVGRTEEALHPSAASTWRDCLDALSEIPALIVSIDDAQNLGPDNLGGLKTLIEIAGSINVVVVVAGTLELTTLLDQSRNLPVGRLFAGSTFEMGGFSADETRAALLAPLHSTNTRGTWSSEAAARVHELTGGFPFLVRCAAKAAFREGTTTEAADVDASLDEILRFGRTVLLPQLSELEDEEILALESLASLHRERFAHNDARAVGVGSDMIGRLVKRAVVKPRGRESIDLVATPLAILFQKSERGLS